MKTLLGAAFLTVSIAGLMPGMAAAMSRSAASISTHYTCEGHVFSRVAFGAAPAACCNGMFGCPQLLANTGLVKPKRASHT